MPPRIKENVSLVQSDMTEFELGGTFGLIVLSATSITLLDDLGKVERLFRTVHRHLSLGGRFVFDLSNPQEHAHQTLRDGKDQHFYDEPERRAQAVCSRRRRERERRGVGPDEFLCGSDRGERTMRFFGSTRKHYHPEERLLALAEPVGFRLLEERKLTVDQEEVQFFILQK
ncbi:hypothetical protein LJK88_28660 [Paenibacillus sp. P26]|nr:hypothetical protein LJK88_28660 [Paenibacillus sp. P26]